MAALVVVVMMAVVVKVAVAVMVAGAVAMIELSRVPVMLEATVQEKIQTGKPALGPVSAVLLQETWKTKHPSRKPFAKCVRILGHHES
jgi:hypothetical protein